jgi:hypothetical protein
MNSGAEKRVLCTVERASFYDALGILASDHLTEA